MTQPNVVLCAATRTAIGTYGVSLKDMSAVDLGAAAIKSALIASSMPYGRQP